MQPNVPCHVSKVLEVDLSAIRFNYLYLSSQLKKNTVCGAVLKADAYGLGLSNIMGELLHAGCKNFFFAFLEEAINAREICPNKNINIFVFGGVLEGTEKLLEKHNIIPCLISLNQVYRWSAYSKAQNKKLPCLLHLDTGLNREGLSGNEVKELLNNKRKILESINILYLMSHLIYAGDTSSKVSKEQLSKMLVLQEQFCTKVSLSRSVGIFLGEQYHCDMVRIGIGLYGYKRFIGKNPPQLRPCLKIYAKILRTRNIKKGETIGYEQSYVCKKDMKIALLSIGYGDGILRSASNKGYVKIDGVKSRIVGMISMDTMTVDISDCPENTAQENQWAELYGDLKSVSDFGDMTSSCEYELLVRLGGRYHRVYKNSNILG